MGPEAKLEKQIGDYAKSKGCLYYKFSSPGNRGVPDRIIVGPTGKVLFMEVKAPGKTPTKLQEKVLVTIENTGAKAVWANSLTAAKVLIDVYVL